MHIHNYILGRHLHIKVQNTMLLGKFKRQSGLQSKGTRHLNPMMRVAVRDGEIAIRKVLAMEN